MQILKIVKVNAYPDQQEAEINEFLADGWRLFMAEPPGFDGRRIWLIRDVISIDQKESRDASRIGAPRAP